MTVADVIRVPHKIHQILVYIEGSDKCDEDESNFAKKVL